MGGGRIGEGRLVMRDVMKVGVMVVIVVGVEGGF